MAKSDSVYSLFGLKDPQQTAREYYKQAFAYDPGRDPYAQAGAGFGNLFTAFLGVPDAIEEQAKLQEIAKDYQPGNLQNMAETYTRLKEAGAPAETLSQLSADITSASTAFNERVQEKRARSAAVEFISQKDPKLANLVAIGGLDVADALKANREARKLESDISYRDKQKEKLSAEITKLNNPATLSQKELFTLAKDFTPDSVKAAVKGNDVSLLTPITDPKEASYIKVDEVVDFDRNGQPIIKTFLVDKTQVGAITGNAPVVDLKALQSGKPTPAAKVFTPGETPPPATTPDVQEELPGIPGLSPDKNIEMREQAMAETMGAQLLVDDIFSPGFEEIAGAPQVGTRLTARFFDTPLAPMAQRMESGAITRAIQVAGDLGVNPTDKDFEVSLKAAPGPNDGPRAWRDWISKQYIPKLKSALASKYGANNPRVIAIHQQLDKSVEEALSTQFEERTTSTGVPYKVKKR